jgi:hypothetical protein
MWIIEQRDAAGSWFTRATVDEEQGAEHYARLYKGHNPKLRFDIAAPMKRVSPTIANR